jgi:hypothetical protein
MSSQLIYFLYSKYSVVCTQMMPTIKSLHPYFNIIPVEIDDPMTRTKVMRANINTVPCVLLQTPSQLMTFEGQKLLDFIQNLVGMVQARQQPVVTQTTAVTNPNNLVQSIVDPATIVAPPAAPSLNVVDSMNSRLQPQVISSPPPPSPILTNQIQQSSQTNVIAQASALQQQQHAQQPSAALPIEALSSGATDAAGLFSNQGGLTMNDINGTATSNMKVNQNGSSLNSVAQQMARQREEDDSAQNPRNNAQLLQQAMSNNTRPMNY